jgi:hypothetical protein
MTPRLPTTGNLTRARLPAARLSASKRGGHHREYKLDFDGPREEPIRMNVSTISAPLNGYRQACWAADL